MRSDKDGAMLYFGIGASPKPTRPASPEPATGCASRYLVRCSQCGVRVHFRRQQHVWKQDDNRLD